MWRIVERPELSRTVKWCRLSHLSPTMDGSVPKHQLKICEMIDAAGPVTKKVKLEEKDQVMETIGVTEPETSPELSPQVVQAMKKLLEAIYPVLSCQNVDLREFLDEHKLTCEEPLSDSVDMFAQRPSL